MGRFSSSVVLLTFLYFIQGLPYGLQARFLPVYLRTKGHSLTSLGFFKTLLAPWLCKALWAPLVDKYSTKQKWLQGSIFGLMVVCALTSIVPPDNTICLCVSIFLLNLFAATQDIAVDSIAVNLLMPEELGQGNTAQVVGYKLGAIFGGGILVWFMDFLGWTGLFLALTMLYVEALLFVYLSPTMRRFTKVRMRIMENGLNSGKQEPISSNTKNEEEMALEKNDGSKANVDETILDDSTEDSCDEISESSQGIEGETQPNLEEKMPSDGVEDFGNSQSLVESIDTASASISSSETVPTERTADNTANSDSKSVHAAESTDGLMLEAAKDGTCQPQHDIQACDESSAAKMAPTIQKLMMDNALDGVLSGDGSASGTVKEYSEVPIGSLSKCHSDLHASSENSEVSRKNMIKSDVDCQSEIESADKDLGKPSLDLEINQDTEDSKLAVPTPGESTAKTETACDEQNNDELGLSNDDSDGKELDIELNNTNISSNAEHNVEEISCGLKKRNLEVLETLQQEESEGDSSETSDTLSQDSFTCSSVKVSGRFTFLWELINVPDTRWIIVYVLIYKLGEQGALGMLPLFFVDSRVKAADVTFWTGVVGQGTSIIGSCLGGWILSHPKYKLPCKLLIYQLSLFRLLPLGMLLWVVLLWSSPMLSPVVLYHVAIVALNILLLVSGMFTTATFTLMMECTKQAPAHIQATHYTFLSSLEVFGKLIFMSICGALVDLFGYTTMYLVFVILAAALLPWLWRYPDILCQKEKIC